MCSPTPAFSGFPRSSRHSGRSMPVMTSKQRFLRALAREIPDRLPVTTHHVMPYFLKKYMHGCSNDEFFAQFGLDPIRWFQAYKPDLSRGEYYDPSHVPGYLEARRIVSDAWRIVPESVPDPRYETFRYKFVTPRKTLSVILQSNDHTSWVTERLARVSYMRRSTWRRPGRCPC